MSVTEWLSPMDFTLVHQFDRSEKIKDVKSLNYLAAFTQQSNGRTEVNSESPESYSRAFLVPLVYSYLCLLLSYPAGAQGCHSKQPRTKRKRNVKGLARYNISLLFMQSTLRVPVPQRDGGAQSPLWYWQTFWEQIETGAYHPKMFPDKWDVYQLKTLMNRLIVRE